MDMAVVERRFERVPFEGTVDLAHGDYDINFQADGVNLGLGGASMRAAYLPDVGSRLSWRFASPTGGSVEADGEVVWTRDEGDCTGEFGIRFLSLSPGTEETLRSLVLARLSVEEPEESNSAPIEENIRLELDGIPTPIVARLVQRGGDLISVRQELPFLRIGMMGRLADGQRVQIAAVDLQMDDGIPLLHLVLERTEEVQASPAGRLHDTLPGTVPAECDDPVESDWSAQADETHTEETSTADTRIDLAIDVLVDDPTESTPLVAEPTRMIDRAAAGFRAAGTPQAMATARAWVLRMMALLGSFAFVRSREALRRTARTLGRFGGALLTRVRGGSERSPRITAGRITARPPGASNIDGLRPKVETQVSARRPRGRTLVVAGLVVTGILVAVFSIGSDPSDGVSKPRVTTGAATPAIRASDPYAVAPVPIVPRDTLSGGVVPQLPSTVPSSSPYAVDVRSETVAGRDPTRAVARPLPGWEPPAQAFVPPRVAADAASVVSRPELSRGAMSFGAPSVPHGRVFTLRMRPAVEGLVGTRLSDGFTVQIPGSLSLDRAKPISMAHPWVSQSMILNEGDHSILTIRFVENKRPAYRVEAKGELLEITIAAN